MKVAASMSVGRLAPKHSLDIDGIRAISPNVTPELIKDDAVLHRRMRGPHLRNLPDAIGLHTINIEDLMDGNGPDKKKAPPFPVEPQHSILPKAQPAG